MYETKLKLHRSSVRTVCSAHYQQLHCLLSFESGNDNCLFCSSSLQGLSRQPGLSRTIAWYRFHLHSILATVIGVARGGHDPPKFLEYLVILWFERRYPIQNTVANIKSRILGWLRWYKENVLSYVYCVESILASYVCVFTLTWTVMCSAAMFVT